MDPKKVLVRNTERPIPKIKVVEDKTGVTEKKKNGTKIQIPREEMRFQTPEVNSTLKIIEKINKVEKTKSLKNENVAFGEKVINLFYLFLL